LVVCCGFDCCDVETGAVPLALFTTEPGDDVEPAGTAGSYLNVATVVNVP